MTPEGKVKAKVREILKSLAPNLWWFAPVAGRFGRAGVPDFVGCAGGHFIAIETKANGGILTGLQTNTVAAIRKSGGTVLIIDETNLPLFKSLVAQVRLTPTGCLLWRAAEDVEWYGKVRYEGKSVNAHKLMYETVIGPVPDGLELDHLCRTKPCIAPWHLEPVTHAENMRRAYSYVTECPQGHEYTEANTIITQRGNGTHRRCRQCKTDYDKRHRAN